VIVNDPPPEVEIKNAIIPGLKIMTYPIHKDSRGWFTENWHIEKFQSLGLSGFRPVQQNVSFNAEKGVTRGIHAEPWDKLVSVLSGEVFSAWVDLREGSNFGQVFQARLVPGVAAFIPKGVGNSFQALEDGTVYSYLVNDHWKEEDEYLSISLSDLTLNIDWPIPISEAIVSSKDLGGPTLSEIRPSPKPKTLMIGKRGQLARAVLQVIPDAIALSSDQFEMGKSNLAEVLEEKGVNAKDIGTVINAAAYTSVDESETHDGRLLSWSVNVLGVEELVRFCRKNSACLVHVSSDYVFDGSQEGKYRENDNPSPLNFYGFTKASADLLVGSLPDHYILRTSWLIGDGNNFVRTMYRLAQQGKKAEVVGDQVGRLTFATELAGAIQYILLSELPAGIYNVSGSGNPKSWADWAKIIYQFASRSQADIQEVSSSYYLEKSRGAPRPLNSTLDLTKIRNSGFSPSPAEESLVSYLRNLSEKDQVQ
jgi:dTDP-4-dehydrorhamnose 3,5-epimerase/reductase